MTELRKALERPVAGLVFDENRKMLSGKSLYGETGRFCAPPWCSGCAGLHGPVRHRRGGGAVPVAVYSGPPGPLCRAGPDRGGGGVHQRRD